MLALFQLVHEPKRLSGLENTVDGNGNACFSDPQRLSSIDVGVISVSASGHVNHDA